MRKSIFVRILAGSALIVALFTAALLAVPTTWSRFGTA